MKRQKKIQITWLGQSCFQVETEGYSIVLDPYEDRYVPGLLPLDIQANEVLCSHGHRDHSGTAAVGLKEGGESPFSVTELSSFHDDQKGALRGVNMIRILRSGGLSAAHLGDLGCEPDPETLDALRDMDVLMIPVGGYYTIDAAQAVRLCRELSPRVVIPMHYRTENFGYDVLDTVDGFLSAFPLVVEYPGDTIEITGETEPHVAVLTCSSERVEGCR